MSELIMANHDAEVGDEVYRNEQYVPNCIKALLEPAGVEANHT